MREHSVHTCSLSYCVHGLHCSFSSPVATSSQAPVSGTPSSKAVVLNRGHLTMSETFLIVTTRWRGGRGYWQLAGKNKGCG